MAEQQSLNSLLQWGIENSSRPEGSAPPSDQPPKDVSRGLNAKALAELLGGPSDADRMREAMSAIVAPMDAIPLDQKMIAWDNFEQLVEQIDNANNIESLGLWPPLLQQLGNDESEMRRMAAWSISTAVQNNVKSQERFLAMGGLQPLSKLALDDMVQAVRKKAVSALSSEVRNFQPALTELEKLVPESVWKPKAGGVDAGDMEAVDEFIQALRDHANRN